MGYIWVMFQRPLGSVLFDAVCVSDQLNTSFFFLNLLKNETESAKKRQLRYGCRGSWVNSVFAHFYNLTSLLGSLNAL